MKMKAMMISMLIITSIAYARHQLQDKKITSDTGIKVYITSIKKALEKDHEQLPTLLKDTEKLVHKIKDISTKAVMHSLLAEMYHEYYKDHRYAINDRSTEGLTLPANIEEWNTKQFDKKIEELLSASLVPQAELKQTHLDDFEEILTKNKAKNSGRPLQDITLYEFLAQRALEIKGYSSQKQSMRRLYEDLLTYQDSLPSKQAVILTQLDYIDYLHLSFKEKRAKLDSLQEVYNTTPYVVEVLNKKLYYMLEDTDSAKTEKYNLCRETIARFSNYERIGLIKKVMANMEQRKLSAQMNKQVYPNKKVSFTVTHTNLSSLTLTLIDNKNSRRIAEHSFQLKNDMPYGNYTDTCSFIAPALGEYSCILASADKKIETKQILHVSKLSTTFRRTRSSHAEIWVTDILSGEPQAGATLKIYTEKGSKDVLITTLLTDKNGMATLKKSVFPKGEIRYKATLGKDTCGISTYKYLHSYGKTAEKGQIKVSLFTDRTLYRAGQCVSFKGIAYVNNIENPYVVKEQAYTVVLRDANGEEVNRQTVKTNDFGSFTGELSIPKHRKMGNYTLSLTTDEARKHIQVAAYKRPTFKITMSDIEEARLGHALALEGKAEQFAGAAISEGKVHYRIMRRPFWLRSNGWFEESCVAEGTAETDSKGAFAISFTPTPQAEEHYTSFRLELRITDSKGENTETTQIFSAGKKGLMLSSSLKDKEEKEATNILIRTHTTNGNPVETKGNYELYLLKGTQKTDEHTRGACVASGQFETGTPLPSATFRTLPSGRYRLRLLTHDKWQQEVSHEQDFTLYSLTDKCPPIHAHTWLSTPIEMTIETGKTADIRFGTSENRAYICYEIYTQKGFIKREIIHMSNEIRSFKVPFLSTYEREAIVSFTFVKEGKLHTEQVKLIRKEPCKKLCIRPLTFRNKLLPGEKETWSFQIKTADSSFVATEVLASMYDASLDALQAFSWNWNTSRPHTLFLPQMNKGNAFDYEYTHQYEKTKSIFYPDFFSCKIDWQEAFANQHFFVEKEAIPFSRMSNYRANGAMGMRMKSAVATEEAARDEVATNPESKTVQPPQNQLRENFQETAFFFPTLQTNEKGMFTMDFILPESNTEWKLQLLAHSKDLHQGIYTARIQSSKPLMVTPNKLRYVRTGDAVDFSTQISNRSKATLRGKVRLELFDPLTNEPIASLANEQKSFSIEAGLTTTASWRVNIPADYELMACRIVAETEHHSDGEQYLIPVLSNKMRITEATPFYLNTKEQTERITLKAKKSIQHASIELTANPLWYVLQALPVLATPDNQSTNSIFTAYYSSVLADHLMRIYPQIQASIRAAQAMENTPDLLQAHLEKNEELKSILLKETPWLTEAKNEKEQLRQLAQLLDQNKRKDLQEETLQSLKEKQLSDGGWSWYNSPYSSPYVTQFILKGMAQLTDLKAIGDNKEVKKMQVKALKFLDLYIKKQYEQGTTHPKHLNEQIIDFLYIRSFYSDIPQQDEAQAAIKHYTAIAEKKWKKASLKGKAQIAQLLLRNKGENKVSQAILTWLRKTATTTAERGMYWANNRRHFCYEASPIETHTVLLSLFKEKGSTEEIEHLKQWLLLQKRTQLWESRPATTEAAYALLHFGYQWINIDNECQIEYAGKSIDVSQKNGGVTAYYKATIPVKPAKEESIVIKKSKQTPAWGAVYQQYEQPIREVKASGKDLKIRKEILSQTKSLKTGDKVTIRLVIDTKEELHYVQIKDMRAACFEPVKQISKSFRQGYLWIAAEPQDASENFFIEHLTAGVHTIEYQAYVSREGSYTQGVATIQSLYAPEYAANSGTESSVITIGK